MKMPDQSSPRPSRESAETSSAIRGRSCFAITLTSTPKFEVAPAQSAQIAQEAYLATPQLSSSREIRRSERRGGGETARSLARSSLPSLPFCSGAIRPSIHRSVSLLSSLPTCGGSACSFARSLARPFVLRRQCVNDQRRQRRRQEGETGAGSRSVAAPPPVDRPPTVSQVTGDTSSFFFSSPPVCGFARPTPAEGVRSGCLSSMGMKSVRKGRRTRRRAADQPARGRARTTGP